MWITRPGGIVRLAIAAVAVSLVATTAINAQQQSATYEVVASFGVTETPNGVIQGRDGQFYGTTRNGNGFNFQLGQPTGTVFAMDAAGARTTLHTFFAPTFSNGGFVGDFEGTPLSSLLEGPDGRLYGTTFNEYTSPLDRGQIFRISSIGEFTKISESYELEAGLIRASDGKLYGVVAAKPFSDIFGSVFRLELDGTPTLLHRFDGTDSADPVGELVQIDDGSLYGATEGAPSIPGTIFRIEPTTGAFAVRYRFANGTRPAGHLIQGTDGLIYGTTVNGGDFGQGTVFSLDAAGTLTTLHHFSSADGANPSAGLIQGFDGRLYGTTANGGASGYGTVFVFNITTRALTTLHDFTLSDGAYPITELIQASDGAFYGAASAGGPQGGGVIFRVALASTPDQYYAIVSRNSGKCLDVYGGSTDVGASAIQWTCHGGPNQQWRLESAGAGAFRIIARHSGQALNVYGAFLDDSTPLIQYPVSGTDNEAWTLEPAGDGYVRIVARHSGKAMDVEYASADDGARLVQFTPHSGANQQWLLRPVESTAAPVSALSAR